VILARALRDSHPSVRRVFPSLHGYRGDWLGDVEAALAALET